MLSVLFVLGSARIHRRRHSFVPNNTGDDIASYASSKCGCSYSYGDAGPNKFDCSGLAQWCHKQAGIKIDRSASSQAKKGTSISWSKLKPGDLVFFDTAGSGQVTHVGIATSSSTMVHSPIPGDVVQEVSLDSYWSRKFKDARRYW